MIIFSLSRKPLPLLLAEGVRVTHVSVEGSKLIFGLNVTDQSPSLNNDVPSSAKDNIELNKDKADLSGYHKNRESAKSRRLRKEPPAMRPTNMGGKVVSRRRFKKMLRPLRNAFMTLFLKFKGRRVLQAKRAALPLSIETVIGETETLMTDRDDNAAAPLHAERPPAKAPRLEDVITAPDKTLKTRAQHGKPCCSAR